MRRMCCLAATVIVAMWATDPTLIAQKQRQIFISLTGPNGAPVADLQAGEVSVTEDGVEGKVVKIEPVNWPTKLHVLVDNGRANTNPINGLRDGLKGLFEQIPEGVEMSMYATAGTPRPLVRPTTDKQKLLDGIGLIAPDSGAGMFFDALSEAAGRIARDKTPHFPVILMVGSDFGSVRASDPDFKKLQETILTRAVTVHIIVMSGTGGTSGGGAQTEIGLGRHQAQRRPLREHQRDHPPRDAASRMGQENRGEPGAPEPSVPRHLRTSGERQGAGQHRRHGAP